MGSIWTAQHFHTVIACFNPQRDAELDVGSHLVCDARWLLRRQNQRDAQRTTQARNRLKLRFVFRVCLNHFGKLINIGKAGHAHSYGDSGAEIPEYGLILEQLQNLPAEGTQVRIAGRTIDILKVDEHAIRTVKTHPPDGEK